MVLRKKEVYTNITPIPGFIPRQLAIDILHSHSEVITLNPLVLSHKPITPPRDAPSDEYYSTWYQVTERIQYIPGIGKLGSGNISFNGCFHNMPWGLQTHTYAPANVDLRIKYNIAGNQPGVEPPEQQEMGLAALGAPKDGLYLKEDIEIRCNFAMVGFVKSQLKAASKEMVDRIIKKAELLDAGVLQAMIEDGKLRTINPNDRSSTLQGVGALPAGSPPMSPSVPYQIPRPSSMQRHNSRPGTAGSQAANNAYPMYPNPSAPPKPGTSFALELPGDFYYPPAASPALQPPPPPQQPSSGHARQSSTSDQSFHSSPDPSSCGRWSQSQPSPGFPPSSRPTSMSSEGGSTTGVGGGVGSPAPDQHKAAFTELPTHQETREEWGVPGPLRISDKSRPANHVPYNPADYARMGH